MKKRILLIPLILLLAMSLMAFGCPPEVEEVVQPPPAVVEVIEWTGQTAWPAGNPYHLIFEDWVEKVHVATGGRLEITLHPVGALVPSGEVFDATAGGVIDVGGNWPPLWFGRDPAFNLFCGGQNIGMDRYEFAAWLLSYGGWEMYQELYARYNLFPGAPIQAWGPEIFLWSKTPVQTKEDLQGLKLRAAGISIDLFAGLGAVPTFLPGAEVIPALEKGVIDATEFGNFFTDVPLGFHEVARYAIMGPGRAPSVIMTPMVNLDSWNALPEDLKQIVISTSWEIFLRSASYTTIKNIEHKEIALAAGIEILEIDEAVMEELEQIRGQLLDKSAAECEFFAKVLDSQRKFIEEYRRFIEITR